MEIRKITRQNELDRA